jgi:hypothetical protein
MAIYFMMGRAEPEKAAAPGDAAAATAPAAPSAQK